MKNLKYIPILIIMSIFCFISKIFGKKCYNN